MQGVVVEINQNNQVIIDLKGRMGQLVLALNHIQPKVGQEVSFDLSYPEVIDETIQSVNKDRKKQFFKSACMYEGIISKITGGGIVIDFKSYDGQLSIPKRLLISDYSPQVGQEVGFMLSYPNLISEKINEDYLKTIEYSRNKRRINNEN